MGKIERYKTEDVAKAMAKGSLLIFIGTTTATAIMALASILIARILGPEQYGAFNLALVIPGLLTAFTDFGTNSALSKFLPVRKEEIRGLIRSGLYFNAVVGFMLSAFLYLFPGTFAQALLNRGDIDTYVRIGSIFIITQALITTSTSIFAGLDETRYNAVVSIATAVVKFTLAVLLVASLSILGTMWGHVLSYVAGAILAILFCLRLYWNQRGEDIDRGMRENLRLMLRYGWPIYSSTFMSLVLIRYQQMVLAWYVTNVEIGNFMVAMNFTSFMTVLTFPINTMILPSFSKLEGDEYGMRRFLQFSTKYALLLVTPISFLVGSASRDLVRLFYGLDYTLAPSYLTIYSLTFAYAIFWIILGNFFNGIGEVGVYLRATLVKLATSLPLALILVSQWKVMGLVASMFISDLISITYIYYKAKVRHGVNIDPRDPLRIFSASIIAALILLLFNMVSPVSITILSLVLNLTIFAISYIFLSMLMKTLRREDMVNLRLSIRGMPLCGILEKFLFLYEKIASLLGMLS